MSAILDAIVRTRVVGIVRLEQYDKAIEIAQALVEGGITAIEFTLTGAGANEAITAVRRELGEAAQIGVGTVLTPAAADMAISAGAQFVVTPIVNPAVIAACVKQDVPILCGAFTPTEAQTAYEAGAAMIKIFPARMGGPNYLRDILAPLPHLKLVPTGGVSVENARSFIEAGAVAVGMGGKLVPAQAVNSGDWAGITAVARATVEAVK